VSDVDGLRQQIASALRPVIAVPVVGHTPNEIADAVLPVVTAWAEQRARQRAAEELETLAFRLVGVDVTDMAVFDAIGDLRAALTDDGQP